MGAAVELPKSAPRCQPKYSDGDIEDIVDHQGACGQQAGIRPEIFLGHDVTPAIIRIGLDCLAVGDVEHRQKARMAAMIGRTRCKLSAPSGIKIVSAASGPYPEDPRASKPSAGTPSSAVILRRLAFPGSPAFARLVFPRDPSSPFALVLPPELGTGGRDGVPTEAPSSD